MQSVFLITYDLRKPGRDYRALHQAIQAFGKTIHPLESVWFIGSSATASQIRDTLIEHIDASDKLLVLQAGKGAAWYNLAASDSATLKASIEGLV